nr:immunoglobulin heavy chain junction region [Macaca mulatta]
WAREYNWKLDVW